MSLFAERRKTNPAVFPIIIRVLFIGKEGTVFWDSSRRNENLKDHKP